MLQFVRQGIVNPTSHNVIKDTSGLKPKHIQMLMYKLTHLYYNWPGTAKVPVPGASGVRESRHKESAGALQETLDHTGG